MDNNQVPNNQVDNNQIPNNPVNNIQIESNQANNNQVPIPTSTEEKKTAEPTNFPVGTLFLILILGGIIAAIYFNKDSLSNKNAEEPAATVKEQKAPEEEKKEEPKQEEKKEEPKQETAQDQQGTLNTSSKSAEITINNKKHTLSLVKDSDPEEEAYQVQLDSKSEFVLGREALGSLKYYVYTSTDSNQYLFLTYKGPEMSEAVYGYVFADDAAKIFEFTSLSEELGCFEVDQKVAMPVVENGKIYYYRDKSNSLSSADDGDEITLERVALTINNRQGTATPTNEEIKNFQVQCE